MLDLLLAALTLGALACGAALLTYAMSRKRARHDRLQVRLRELVGIPQPVTDPELDASRLVRHVRRMLRSAGITPELWQLCVLLAAASSAVAAGAVWKGLAGAGVAPLLLMVAAWLALGWRVRRRRRRVLDSLPFFLDHVLRAIETGESMVRALEVATADASGPLRELFERVNRRIVLGASLDAALQEAVAEVDLCELHLLALTLRVDQRFAGDMGELLRSMNAAVRQRERSRRELGVLTAETRATAARLALLPVLIVLYSFAVHPEHYVQLRSEGMGRLIIAIATGLQISGSLWLWRMVRSVRRA
jgi:tight adherence protein B